jgi:hypothetical protein
MSGRARREDGWAYPAHTARRDEIDMKSLREYFGGTLASRKSTTPLNERLPEVRVPEGDLRHLHQALTGTLPER